MRTPAPEAKQINLPKESQNTMTQLLPLPSVPPALTPARRAAFLENLRLYGNVRLACRAASLSPQTAYRARQAELRFMTEWDAALVVARTHVEAILADRAISGVTEKVFYHGEEVATRTRYDSRLLLAHLARLDRLAERIEQKEAEEARLRAQSQTRSTYGCDQHQSRAAGECKGARPPAATRPLGRMSEEIASADALAEQQKTQNNSSPLNPPIPELEQRLMAMEAERPLTARAVHQFDDPGEAEAAQLCAFEAGMDRWWAVARTQDLPEHIAEGAMTEYSDQSGDE